MSSKSPIQDGLVNPGVYFDPFEGPYTRVAKFCLINGVHGKRADSVLFGERKNSHLKSGKIGSLLHCATLRRTKGLHELGSTIFSGSLSDFAGTWSELIGTDVHFRFCPECILSGFQSSIHQILAIARCPIHQNTDIESFCSYCNQVTPDYTFEAAASNFPLHCTHCKNPFGGMHLVNVNYAARHNLSAIRAMHRWLRQVGQVDSSILTWDGGPDPSIFKDSFSSSLEFMSFMKSLVPPPAFLADFTPVRLFVSSMGEDVCRYGYGLELEALQRSIYRSIRRWIEHKFSISSIFRRVGYTNAVSPDFKNRDDIGNFDRILINGWLRWRNRFEVEFLEILSINKLRLKNIARPLSPLPILLRSQVTCAPHYVDVNIDCWANFVLQSFYEDMREAIAWYKLTFCRSSRFEWAILSSPGIYLREWKLNSHESDVNHRGVHHLILNFPGIKENYYAVFSHRDAETDYFLRQAADRTSSSKPPDLEIFSQWSMPKG